MQMFETTGTVTYLAGRGNLWVLVVREVKSKNISKMWRYFHVSWLFGSHPGKIWEQAEWFLFFALMRVRLNVPCGFGLKHKNKFGEICFWTFLQLSTPFTTRYCWVCVPPWSVADLFCNQHWSTDFPFIRSNLVYPKVLVTDFCRFFVFWFFILFWI